MFHDRKSKNKINKIHERALRITHGDSTSNLNPSFMAEIFVTKDVPYVFHGIDTIRFIDQKLWQTLPK